MFQRESSMLGAARLFNSCFRPCGEGTCSVCQYKCNTKACKCAFLHRECARELVRRAERDTCGICNTRYKMFHLERQPVETVQEQRIAKAQEKLAQQKDRALLLRIKSMCPTIARSLIPLYPFLEGAKRLDVHMLIQDVERNCETEIELVENLRRNGITQSDATRHVEFVKEICTIYDLLSPRNKQSLSAIFRAALCSSETWDD